MGKITQPSGDIVEDGSLLDNLDYESKVNKSVT